jgi:Fe-S-cluster containining protein
MWWRDGFQHLSACCQACVGACGYALSSIKWPRFLRILTLGSLARYWQPSGMAIRTWACAEPGHKEEIRSG